MTSKINPAIAKLAMSVSRLREDPHNVRKHDDRNVTAIAASLQEFGQQKPIVALKDGTVIAGSGTLRAAQRLGWDKLAVATFDSRDVARAKAYAIADNRSAELAEWDVPVLNQTLQELQAAGLDIDRTLHFKDDELKDLLVAFEHEHPVDMVEDEVPQPPANPVTKRGDVWVLGSHRLMCGDAGDAAEVKTLLDGSRIHLVNTDPPYNVNVEPRSNNAILAAGKARRHHQHFDVARMAKHGRRPRANGVMRPRDRALVNDFIKPEEFERLLRLWFGNLASALESGRAFYIWGGYANCANYPPALKEKGLYFSQAIIWVKEHPVMTRKDFMGNHEWCFYGWREGAAHYFVPDIHNATDVWAVKKINPNRMVHLTEKPVELAARAMTYSSRPGEKVLDLFGGSGSTLVAAEQMNRKALLMEVDPAYCDVIVQRWEALARVPARRIKV